MTKLQEKFVHMNYFFNPHGQQWGEKLCTEITENRNNQCNLKVEMFKTNTLLNNLKKS